jgi:hypothetical protein
MYMKRRHNRYVFTRRKASAAVLFVLGCLALAACSSRETPPPTAEPIAPDTAQQALKTLDTNGDGSLDMKELEKAPGLKQAVVRIKKLAAGRGAPPSPDKLKGEKITADEINGRIQEWKDSGVGRMPVPVTVTRKGKPLVGATVTFVPEPFLGPGLSKGTGTTDGKGIASISVPQANPTDPVGMSPGFFRVEITKSGDSIPAKYNTQTTLGQEVAPDATGLATGGIKFDLEY